ncbi:rab11 family-interacting protein 3 isoform X2 [Dendropsophus ebraccatus]|uniref:rab11 family-interacting protein 3 isoform X2 n=1 Tax=Dendropsophus ebraccatus TaxID=150705 RepID=UPI0038316234
MKMEGDPHVTDWGVMRGQALDLITPQQVVGGLLLLNAEEKACIALQPRLEILDEPGELMSAPHPLLSQHDEPLPGAGEGQRCQSRSATAKPWTGEEDGRLTLCTLNIGPPDYVQNPPIYKPSMNDQLPPLIIAPPENAHLPLCPALFSQEAEQNLEDDILHRDSPPPDYLLDVRSLFIPNHISNQDPQVSALDPNQVPEPINSLSADLEQMLLLTSDVVPDTSDQMTPCLPLKIDQHRCVGPLLDPDVEPLPLCNSSLSLPLSETLVAVRDGAIEQLPHLECHLIAVTDQLPQCAPCVDPIPIQLPQSEYNWEPDSKNVPVTESFVDTQINSCLDPSPEQLPQTKPNWDPDPKILSQTKPLGSDPKHLSKTESNFNPDTKLLHQNEPNLDPDHEILPQTEPNLNHDPEHLSPLRSIVCSRELCPPDTEQLPLCAAQVDIDFEELPLTESFVVTKGLFQSISHLDPDTEMVAQSESYFHSKTDHLPHSETDSWLTPDLNLPSPSVASLGLHVDTTKPELLPSLENSVTSDHSEFCLDPNTDTLPHYDQLTSHENLPPSQPLVEFDTDQLEYFCPETPRPESDLGTSEFLDSSVDQLHHFLDSDIENFNLGESFMAHDSETALALLSPLVSTTDQLTHPIFNLNLPELNPGDGQLQDLPHPESDKIPSRDPLPLPELSVDQMPNSESLLDPDPDQLPWFELSMCPDITQLPFTTHNFNGGESSLAHEADELSLCDPFLAPDHYESVSKSVVERLTLGDTYLEPPTCESSDMGDKAMAGPLMEHNVDTLQQSGLGDDQLPIVESVLDSVPVPTLSGILVIERGTGLEFDGRPETELYLTTDDDMFFLSETFLAHDMDQISLLDQYMTSETDQLPMPDGDQAEPCKPLDCDRSQLDTCLSPDNDQLPLSNGDQLPMPKCPLIPHNDQLRQFESSLVPITNQMSTTEFFTPQENNNEYLDQCEPHLDTEDDLLLESSLRPDIDQLPQLESSLCKENEHVSQSESGLGLDDDYLSTSDACSGSDSDQFSNFETPICTSGDQWAQSDSHLVPNSDLLPQLEMELGLESEELCQDESHSEHPHSDPYTDHMTKLETFFHQDFDQFPQSECQKASDTTQPNVFEATSTPDQIHLVASPTKSPLTQDTDHFPLSESFVTPTLNTSPLSDPTTVVTVEMPSSESLLTSHPDHHESLQSSAPLTSTHIAPLDPSALHSSIHLPLFDQSTSPETSESHTTPHSPLSQTPGTLDSTKTPLCDSSIISSAPSNTDLPSVPEELQFPWDWTLPLSETSLSCELPQSSPEHHDKPEDCFSIFCLDTPPDSSHTTPEADLALSDDLLSLCDVFAHLQTDDILYSQSDPLHISTNGDTDYHVEGDQFLFQKDLELNLPSKSYTCHSASPPFHHGLLDSESDQSDDYCLDLLFEPSRNSTEDVVDSPPMEKPSTTNNSDDSLVSHSVSSLISSRSDQSSSQLLVDLVSLQPPAESTQVPVIVVTDPLELLSASDDHPDTILAKSPNALPLEMPTSAELELDAHGEVVEVPSSEMKEPPDLKLDQLPTDCLESSELLVGDGPAPSPQPQSDSILGTALPTFMPPGELQLTRMGSPFEGIKLRSRDSQYSASALMPFGEGDPLLAFTLDNDSPCAGDELARLRAVFDALDRDKDGFVKMEDFVQFATVYGAEQVKYLTGYLDPAGLGVINFRDFYRGISEIQNEDLDMQLYDMGYPSEEEPACSVDFDDLAAFEVTEVTDSAYVGSESAYSECETFTDEDTGGLAAQEDPETEGDGAGSRGHASATPEGLELSLCDISGVTVTGQEEQFEDFGEGAEPDLFNSHCEEEQESFTQATNTSHRLTSSPDKRPSSRKEARRLHHSGFLGEDQEEQPHTNMSFDDTYLTDKVLYLEQRVTELERDAAMTSEQQNRLRQENLHLLHRAHALEEQLKDQEERSDEVQSEETRKHRDELRKMERDRGFRLSSLKARVQELENENTELRSQLPSAKATTQRLEEEKYKLLDQVEELQRQLKDHQEQNKKLGGKLSKEKHKQQLEKERCQEVIEELRRELEQTQLLRLEMEQRLGLGNSNALQEYNSRTREAELEQEVRRLKQEQRLLKEQNEELNGQIINLSIQGAKNLFSTTFSDSLAAEISSVSRDELMEAIHKQEEINLRLQDYIDRIIVAIMETNPAILEVKIH